jgi:hypothetical protein
LGGGGAAVERLELPEFCPVMPPDLLMGGGMFFAANFAFLAFCVQSGQVTSLALAD